MAISAYPLILGEMHSIGVGPTASSHLPADGDGGFILRAESPWQPVEPKVE